MAIIKKTRDHKCCKDAEKREPSCTIGRKKLVQPLWKTVQRFLRKLKLEPPYEAAISFLGIYPKD